MTLRWHLGGISMCSWQHPHQGKKGLGTDGAEDVGQMSGLLLEIRGPQEGLQRTFKPSGLQKQRVTLDELPLRGLKPGSKVPMVAI